MCVGLFLTPCSDVASELRGHEGLSVGNAESEALERGMAWAGPGQNCFSPPHLDQEFAHSLGRMDW